MEWVEPNYNIVDIAEYEMMLDKRRSIEDFVVKFFKYWEFNDISNKLVYICQDLVTDQRLQRMANQAFPYSTIENFLQSYRNMCSELFSEDTEVSHITVLLAFSIVFDRKMKTHSWYSPIHLFTALIDSLVEASFDSKKFEGNRNHSDMLETLRVSMFIILPSLLFCFFFV